MDGEYVRDKPSKTLPAIMLILTGTLGILFAKFAFMAFTPEKWSCWASQTSNEAFSNPIESQGMIEVSY